MARPRKKIITLEEDALLQGWDGTFDPGEFLTNLVNSINITDNTQAFLLKQERREIPRAANIMEFCFSSSYLNFPLFPRQLQIAGHLLGEICPFCSDNDFMYQMFNQDISEINDRVVFTTYGRCPKCGKTKIDFIRHDRWKFPQALIAIIGQRSGKNYLFAPLACYQLHRFLTLDIDGDRVLPSKYFGTGPGMLTMTFTAYTLGQAMKTMWNVFKPMFEASPWFREYGKFLNHYGRKFGEELYANNSTYIRYKNKNIDIACAAPNQSSLRGATRILFGVDEFCWFDTKLEEKGKKADSVQGSIEDIWTALNRSLKTIRHSADKLLLAGRYDTPTALDVSISSPVHANDFGMRRLRLADSDKRIYPAHYATWEFNPEFSGRQDFASEYLANPETAERDYGAIPPLTVSPWIIDNKPILLASRTKVDQPIVTYNMRTTKSVFGETSAWLELNNVRDASSTFILAIDNGYNNNAFAFSLVTINQAGKPTVAQCGLLKPTSGYVVNLSKMWEEFIYPICHKLNTPLVLYDRWNSLQNVQKLQSEGKDARQYSLTPKDFDMLRMKLLSGDVSYPFSEYDPGVFSDVSRLADVDLVQVAETRPGFALLLQTLTVRQFGGRVTKPLAGDDDIFRTAMLGLRFVYNEEIAESLKLRQSTVVEKRKTGLIHSISARGSSSSSGVATSRPDKDGKSRALVLTTKRYK